VAAPAGFCAQRLSPVLVLKASRYSDNVPYEVLKRAVFCAFPGHASKPDPLWDPRCLEWSVLSIHSEHARPKWLAVQILQTQYTVGGSSSQTRLDRSRHVRRSMRYRLESAWLRTRPNSTLCHHR